MSKNVDIEVFPIAKTVVDRQAVRKWLDYLEVSQDWNFPAEEIVSNPALNIALAGKRCYMSYEAGLNKNVTRIRDDYGQYFDNILNSGHGCYDDETDVLTERGWINWKDIQDDDRFCTVVDNTIQYVKANYIIRSQYKGRMYRVKSGGVDLLVTPNHRMYVCKTTTKEGRKKEKYQFIKAEDLGHVSHAYCKNLPYKANIEADYEDTLIYALLGFSIGDGNIKSKRRINFHLRKERKIRWLENICTMLDWALKENKDHYTVEIPDEYSDLFSQIYDSENEKVIPQHLLTKNRPEVILGLYDGLINSDGSISSSDISYHTTSIKLAGQFQHLCLLLGISANIGVPQESGFGDKLVQSLCVQRRNNKLEVNKFVGSVGRTSWIEEFEGDVYCAELPEHTSRLLYVRRNGKPVWCGNSVLEHSVYSFAIEGVSRVFTAEMNRHRAGWAISEGSLRFIRFDKFIPWWRPTSITPLPTDDEDLKQRKNKSFEIFQRAFQHQTECYRELLDVWDMDASHHNFHYKKVVTSCLRRIIGMGVATGGVWSGNIRALRHVITMRCSPQAEEEICYVFSKIVKYLKDEEPLLFGDFYQDDQGFWRPKYVKV